MRASPLDIHDGEGLHVLPRYPETSHGCTQRLVDIPRPAATQGPRPARLFAETTGPRCLDRLPGDEGKWRSPHGAMEVSDHWVSSFSPMLRSSC